MTRRTLLGIGGNLEEVIVFKVFDPIKLSLYMGRFNKLSNETTKMSGARDVGFEKCFREALTNSVNVRKKSVHHYQRLSRSSRAYFSPNINLRHSLIFPMLSKI